MTDEKLNYLKNKISMELKKTVTQQEFEIIFKRLSDLEKENVQLKEQISILLSCKSCPDNKGGYICDKEYNDKCLGQKIQEVKVLQKYVEKLSENIAELKAQIEKMRNCDNCRNGCTEECEKCFELCNWELAE